MVKADIGGTNISHYIHKFILSCSSCAQLKITHSWSWSWLIQLLNVPFGCSSSLLLSRIQNLFSTIYSLADTLAFWRIMLMTQESNSHHMHVWKGIMGKVGMSISLTSRYRPQANCHVERANQEIGRFLRTFCTYIQEDWAHSLVRGCPRFPLAFSHKNHAIPMHSRLSTSTVFMECQPYPLTSQL